MTLRFHDDDKGGNEKRREEILLQTRHGVAVSNTLRQSVRCADLVIEATSYR